MSPSFLTNQLRQNQVLQQMQQAAQGGPGAALLGGGANLQQFDDTAGGTQTTTTGVQPPAARARGTVSPGSPLGRIEGTLAKGPQAISNIPQGIYNRMHGLGGAPNPVATEVPQDQRPTLMQGGAPVPPKVGPRLSMDANGNIVVNQQPSFTPMPTPQYTPFNPDILPQGRYNPNL